MPQNAKLRWDHLYLIWGLATSFLALSLCILALLTDALLQLTEHQDAFYIRQEEEFYTRIFE